MKTFLITEEQKNILINYFATKPLPLTESFPIYDLLNKLPENSVVSILETPAPEGE